MSLKPFKHGEGRGIAGIDSNTLSSKQSGLAFKSLLHLKMGKLVAV